MATILILVSCLVLSLGQAFLTLLNPIFGLASAMAITLMVLLFVHSELALPLYIIAAAPTGILSGSGSGILSRLYIGDVLFALIVGIWLLRKKPSERKMEPVRRETRILIPFICLAFIGFLSIIYSDLFPDPDVTYAFVHLCIVIVPGMVRTLRDAQWLIGAYLLVGLPYALGTIFAGPLHLLSPDVILGVQRPAVFGTGSSGLGILNLLFTCLALGQMLYTKKDSTRLGLGLLTCIYTGGVVMAFGRESWIGLLIATWVILWIRFKSPIALFLPLVILPLLLLFFPDIVNFFNPTKVYGADRINIWQDAIAIWLRSPYMGVGAGNYQFFDIAYGTEVVGVAHNQFLSVLAEMGVQGVVCLLVALIMIGRAVLKRFNAAISDLGKAIALAYLGYFAALLFATFFTGSFLPSTASGGGTGAFIAASYPWVFLGLVFSIPNWDREAATLDMPAISEYAELDTK